MKFVPYRIEGDTKSRAIFISALENGPVVNGQQLPIGMPEMSRRFPVLGKIKDSKETARGIELEDAECATLEDAVKAISAYHVPHEAMGTLLAIRDDVVNAKKPEMKPAEKSSKGKAA